MPRKLFTKRNLAMYTLPLLVGIVSGLLFSITTWQFWALVTTFTVVTFLRDWAIRDEIAFNQMYKGI